MALGTLVSTGVFLTVSSHAHAHPNSSVNLPKRDTVSFRDKSATKKDNWTFWLWGRLAWSSMMQSMPLIRLKFFQLRCAKGIAALCLIEWQQYHKVYAWQIPCLLAQCHCQSQSVWGQPDSAPSACGDLGASCLYPPSGLSDCRDKESDRCLFCVGMSRESLALALSYLNTLCSVSVPQAWLKTSGFNDKAGGPSRNKHSKKALNKQQKLTGNQQSET